jgi:uncharacterized membrane protein
MVLNILLAINRYGHDFSSAMWVAGIFFLYILNKEAKVRRNPILSEFVFRIYRKLNVLLWVSFVLILLCGTVRAVTYRQFEWNENMGQYQVWLLLIKHIVFFFIVVLGISFWWRLQREIRNISL